MSVVIAIGMILLLDLVSGIVHWAEDTFWTESTPIVGTWIVAPNVLHHRNSTAFVSNTWLQSSWDLLAVGVIVLGAAWLTDLLTWQTWLFVVIGVNANQIHKWNHMRASDVPAIIRMLQSCRLMQNSSDHAAHHRGDKNSAYCVITPFVNPVLDRVGFWRFLERMLVPMFTAPRREDLK